MIRKIYPQYKLDKVALIRQYIKLSGKSFLVLNLKNATFKELTQLRNEFEDKYQIHVAKITLLNIAMQQEGIGTDKLKGITGTTAILYATNDLEDRTLCFYKTLQLLLKKKIFLRVISGVLNGKEVANTSIKSISKYDNFQSLQLNFLQSMQTVFYKGMLEFENNKAQLIYLLQKKVELSTN